MTTHDKPSYGTVVSVKTKRAAVLFVAQHTGVSEYLARKAILSQDWCDDTKHDLLETGEMFYDFKLTC